MPDETADLNRLFVGSPQTVLERTLTAEYLFSKGYLMSDLRELPPQVATSLMLEACRFAALRLAEIESKAELYQKFRLPISLN
jgi:hypothetical protein